MATVGEVAKLLGKSPQTIRAWTEQYKAGEAWEEWQLSPASSPDAGEVRNYSEEDIQKLAYIRRMREELVSFDDIQQGLKAGKWEEEPLPGRSEALEPAESYAIALRMRADIERMQLELTTTQETLESTRQERDKLAGAIEEVRGQRNQLEARVGELLREREDLIKEAVRASTLLEASRGAPVVESPGTPTGAAVQAQSEGRGRKWYEFWRRT